MSRGDCFKAEEKNGGRSSLETTLERETESTGELFKRKTEPSRLERVNRETREVDLQTKTLELRLLSTSYVLIHGRV
jgi:hypothetical protein